MRLCDHERMATRKPDQVPSPRDLPATVEEVLAAQNAGREAALAGARVSECPYRPNSPETGADGERAAFLRLMWSRAYRAALTPEN